MPKFAANLSFLFGSVSFPERFTQAAQAGFMGVEYLFPYAWPPREVAGWLSESGMQQILFNLPPGDWEAGERGLACQPGQQSRFRESLELALMYADRLGCKRLHAMAGLACAGVDEVVHEAVFLENLSWGADQCRAAGVTLLIEPINSQIDMPGYWLNHPDKAFRLHRILNHPAVKVQLDLYHARVVNADLAGLLSGYIDQIGHIQIADYPGRHEPGTGEIDYLPLFQQMDDLGYLGWVGCEYRPTSENNGESLTWFDLFRT